MATSASSSDDEDVVSESSEQFDTNGILMHKRYTECYFRAMLYQKHKTYMFDPCARFNPLDRLAPSHSKFVYMVHWKRYSFSDDTWEPESNLTTSNDLTDYKRNNNMKEECVTFTRQFSWNPNEPLFGFDETTYNKYLARAQEDTLSSYTPAVEKIVNHVTYDQLFFRYMFLRRENQSNVDRTLKNFHPPALESDERAPKLLFKVRWHNCPFEKETWEFERYLYHNPKFQEYKKEHKLPEKSEPIVQKYNWSSKDAYFGFSQFKYERLKEEFFVELKREGLSLPETSKDEVEVVLHKKRARGRPRKVEVTSDSDSEVRPPQPLSMSREVSHLVENWQTPATQRYEEIRQRDLAAKSLSDVFAKIREQNEEMEKDQAPGHCTPIAATPIVPAGVVLERKQVAGEVPQSKTQQKRSPSQNSNNNQDIQSGKKVSHEKSTTTEDRKIKATPIVKKTIQVQGVGQEVEVAKKKITVPVVAPDLREHDQKKPSPSVPGKEKGKAPIVVPELSKKNVIPKATANLKSKITLAEVTKSSEKKPSKPVTTSVPSKKPLPEVAAKSKKHEERGRVEERGRAKDRRREEKKEKKKSRKLKVLGYCAERFTPFAYMPFPRRRIHSCPPCDRGIGDWYLKDVERRKKQFRTYHELQQRGVVQEGVSKVCNALHTMNLYKEINKKPVYMVKVTKKMSSKGKPKFVAEDKKVRKFLRENDVRFKVPSHEI